MSDRAERLIDSCVADPRRTVSDEEFSAVALEVFAYQYGRAPLYRRLCEMRGARPAGIDHWTRIPAAPSDLFKEDLASAGGASSSGGTATTADPAGEAAAVESPAPASGGAAAGQAATFLSSGTTQGAGRRSRHAVSARSYELYRRASLAHFSALVLPDSPGAMSVLVLGPLPATHAHSSLGHMFGFVAGAFAADVAQPFDADGRLDVDAAVAWLEAAAAATRPVLVLALSSAVTAVIEALRTRKLALRLPADSRLVDTGGSKGGRTFSRAGILKAAWRFLHIPSYLCVGEYGMTELLSQFYEDTYLSRWSGSLEPRAKVGPPWTRTLVVDPATLEPVARGERGILRHVDLANFESIAAVQTLDIGVARGRGFEVLGRASGAETRGCSQLMSVLCP